LAGRGYFAAGDAVRGEGVGIRGRVIRKEKFSCKWLYGNGAAAPQFH